MRWLGQFLAWLVILGVGSALAAGVVAPRIAGATSYTVLTGSMQPDLPPGTLAVVRPVSIDEIGLGDVITYQLESGEPTVVTHRVVGLGFDAAGDPMITTQGDANEAPDTKPVREVQVKGELWYSVPYLGRINTLLTGSERQWAVYGVAALLLAYTAQAWGSAWRDRRRRMERNDEAITPHAPTAA